MLSQTQKDIIIKEMLPFNPSKIGILGSVARNESTETSDIDILYVFDNDYTLFDLAGLHFNLESLLKKEIDLVELTSIKPFLRRKYLMIL